MRSSVMIVLFSLSCVTVLQADVIYLKNGKKLECTGVQEVGEEVKYTIAGGTVTIPKSMVVRIEKSDSKKPETGAQTPSP